MRLSISGEGKEVSARVWLVDTNIWLEVLLKQDRSDQAERFL